ncbi:ImmA/IrrE family metallo-endopeptidase [Lacinutrix sp. Bg11-31]|uniref:helix-turn-helix domain-containing protein n=1 Tax=Lacinutrix sp. Bg11-31 TaxID=2057808 RepID=UPI000C31B4A3|nr:XRE family transcriptional regulator [Lacinutrix sp. Bg11-31]AUC82553.1 DNA-binding protein [Lacinutrix sp. Bg11-31]
MELNYKQLIFAREYRKYSQTDLASHINGLSQSNLSKFEKGLGTLSDEIVQKIILFLDFPEKFFVRRISNRVENAHYRKKSAINKSTRLDIEYGNKIIGFIIDQMTNSVEWPEFLLKPIDIEDGFSPKTIAKYIRKQMGLDIDMPVKNIFNLLESNGIIVVQFDTTEKFDGVSFLTDKGNPVIVINSNFSNDRKRFTLSHELAHIIMHIAGGFLIPEYRNVENEANDFASEFLMPEEHIKQSLRNLKLSELAEHKIYWLTSMASLIRRAKDVGSISYDRYRYLNIELSRKWGRKSEPVNVFIDEPKLFLTSYKMHKNDLEYSDLELAEAFGLPLDVLKRFCDFSKGNSKLRVLL